MKRLFQLHVIGRLSVALLFVLSLCGGNGFLPGIAVAETLTVTKSGTGTGTVNSIPSGFIACPGDCTEVFSNGTAVTLAAAPDWKSLHTWSGNCSVDGNGYCTVTMDTDKTVTATFTPNYQAAVLGMFFTEYDTLAGAYANASNFDFFGGHVYTFMENLIIDRHVAVTFYGGMDEEYITQLADSFTTLQGSLEIQYGTLVVDALIIK